jgi:hypothetical protein
MKRKRKTSAAIVLLAVAGLALTAQAEVPDYLYETYLDGYYLSRGKDLVVDEAGNAYVIASWYENQVKLDILIFKLDPEGTLVWTLPIVGDSGAHDSANDIALGPDGAVWVVGWTDSESFPTTPDALDDTLTGFRDAVIMKLDPDDGTILYSTLLGGDYTERGQGICVMDDGTVLVVGSTGSTDFPTTPGAYQEEPNAPLYIYTDAFITKLSADGGTILYSSHFGGFEDDGAIGADCDSEGNIVLAGYTYSDDIPLMNPIQSMPDYIFAAKLSSDLSTLGFGTYLGGADSDRLIGMAVGPDDHIYLVGVTRSINFPTTPGSFQEDFVGEILGCEEGFPSHDVNCDDGFLVKMATDGGGLAYSTYVGGVNHDFTSDVVVDDNGCAYVSGYTSSPSFLDGDNFSSGLFATKFNPEGNGIAWVVTKESGSANAGHGIAIDATLDVYFTGAVNVPADIYVAKLDASTETAVPGGSSPPGIGRLAPNYPNPFNPSTTITFDLDHAQTVKVTVLDIAGKRVATLEDGILASGRHEVVWHGTDDAGRTLPSGSYFVRVDSEDGTRTRKVTMIK